MKYVFCAIMVLSIGQNAWAQAPERWTSGEIYEQLKRLNTLASAMYVAAHPDDENTRLISYLANHEHANTAYISMTRGDGGQNLIGSEIRELLGVIRTQELLAARRIDGGQQFFTRANDFGFSKDPDETFTIWDKEIVMQDLVYAIRKFKPDVVVNRFSTTPSNTHGHHTASAMLSNEAFELAADPKVYPEQVAELGVWQSERLFFNTSWWFYGSREKFEKADKSNLFTVDIGVFYPLRGKSNTEIAAESRSMHKCQGFGMAGTRGTEKDYLELLKGSKPDKNIFDGINTTWTRIKGGAPIGEAVAKVLQNFKHEDPAASINDLMAVRRMILALPDGEHWKSIKLKEIERLIYHCAGLFLEATADDFSAVGGEAVQVKVEAVNRSNAAIFLKSVTYLPKGSSSEVAENLENNKTFVNAEAVEVPLEMPYTTPYWLQGNATLGMYDAPNSATAILPQLPESFSVRFELTINGEDFSVEKPIVYKRADPVKAEVYRPFAKLPAAFVRIKNEVYVFADNEPKTLEVAVKAGKAGIKGRVSLELPKGWRCEPQEMAFDMSLKGAEETVQFKVFPSSKATVEQVTAVAILEDGSRFSQALIEVAYDHIPVQTVLMPATTKVVRVDLKKRGEKVGYIVGAGDEIPQSLEQIGYAVDLLQNKDFTTEKLAAYDAIILGVRAYNTVEDLKFHQEKLLEYVKNGGTMIVQYNTDSRLVLDSIAPFSLALSRDRVAVEAAEVRILAPEHPVMNTPNKITNKDFEGWVQERGLYFPNKWDAAFVPILSANDPNETPKDGGLLVAKYGKGHYIYTGYAWFRELPAGVPGAFRIFTNLISIGR